MDKRALVIGSQTAGLEGPNDDARRVKEALAALGFEVDLRADPTTATRAGILAGYRSLIDRTKPGDAALFYYSGHGLRVLPEPGTVLPPGARPSYQAIVPTDFEASSDGDFRGIVDVELSVLLAQLTARTENVTVLLDCCHAAGMSRRLRTRPKSLLRDSYVDLQAHVERARGEGLAVDLLAPSGNPLAVRFVAAAATESAFEYINDQGDPVGAFTESLLLALQMAGGQRVTWDSLEGVVRERVGSLYLSQRPDVEGPRRRRYLFETEEAAPLTAFSIVPGSLPGRAELRAGKLHGVRVGDEYELFESTVTDPKGAARIGTAAVTAVLALTATADLSLVPPRIELPTEAKAFPLVSAAPKLQVRLTCPEADRAAIEKEIEATGRFTVAEDPVTTTTPMAQVRVTDGRLGLFYPSGEAVVPDAPYSTGALKGLVQNLRMVAAAEALLSLRSEGLPDSALTVEWGVVEKGQPVVLRPTGEALSVGQSFFVRVTNQHPLKKKLFVSMFDIGVTRSIQLLTYEWPSGFELAFGEAFTLGTTVNGDLEGIELGWSDQLPEDEVRGESLVVIAAEAATNLSALETPGALHWSDEDRQRKAFESGLESLVRQVQHGASRDPRKRSKIGYLVQHTSFELSPWPMPPAGGGFLVDDRPPGSVRLFAPRAIAKRSRRVAVRLVEMIVHDTKSWFGGADVRVDSLVVTRARPEGPAPYRSETFPSFKGVRDEERLSFDNLLVYEGEVRDFLDLRVWVSRDVKDSLSLSEMLSQEVNSTEFKTAAAALLAVTAAAPQAAPIVAAVGATATLTAIAWRVLSAALPKSIGVYQTSLLAGEGAGFGAGRHPPSGLFRAQGFSFAYEVVLLD